MTFRHFASLNHSVVTARPQKCYRSTTGNATDPTTDFATGQPQSVYRVDHSIIYNPLFSYLS